MPPSSLGSMLIVVLVNVVPVVGVQRFGWSAANVLVLYWVESLLFAGATICRLLLHRRLTRKRGYWRAGQVGLKIDGKPVRAGFIGEYVLTTFTYAVAHGIFVVLLVSVAPRNHAGASTWQLDTGQVLRGAAVVSVMLVAGLVADSASLRSHSFADMKSEAQGRLGRTFIMHLALMFGMFAMAATGSPSGVLYALIAFKTLAELEGIPVRRPWVGRERPPRWMLDAATRLAKADGNPDSALESWRRCRDRERREACEDEKSMPRKP
jgi:hypothetical protein